MSNKGRLFEMMGKIDPTFKNTLNENIFNGDGEPNMTHSQARDYTEPSEPNYDDNSPDMEMSFESIIKKLEGTFDTILDSSGNGSTDFLSKEHDIMLYNDKNNVELYIDGDIKYQVRMDRVNSDDLIRLIKPYTSSILKGSDAEEEMNSISKGAAYDRMYSNQERGMTGGV